MGWSLGREERTRYIVGKACTAARGCAKAVQTKRIVVTGYIDQDESETVN